MSVFTPTYFPNSLGMFAMKIYRHLVMTKSCSIIISENLDFGVVCTFFNVHSPQTIKPHVTPYGVINLII